MAMRIRQYGAERIAQYGRSRDTLEATGCHWMPPLGEYLPRIDPAVATVIDFGVKNRVVALWKSLSKASVQMALNGPSTQLIEGTSFVERWNATIKAEELS